MRPHHLDYVLRSGGEDIVINVLKPYNIAGVVGSVFWVVCYVYAIREGFQNKTFGIPKYAVCTNFGWEILGAFVVANPIKPWLWLEKAWFFLDLVIVWQVLRYGAKSETIPEIKKNHTAVILSGIAMACVLQWGFIQTFDDTLAFMVAFIIDFVMSVLFVFMHFERRDAGNAAWAIAWTKLAGNVGVSIQSTFFLADIHPNMKNFSLFYFLFVATFVFDVIYVYLLWQLRRSTAQTPSPATT